MRLTAEIAIRSVFDASDAGRIHFVQVIVRLVDAQFEAYNVDYRTGRISCYRYGDSVVELGSDRTIIKIADRFDVNASKAVICNAHEGRVKFSDFLVL